MSADDVVAGTHHGAESIGRGHAAGEDVRGASTFERGQVFFKPGASGVRDARIFISLILADLFLHIGRGRINGNGNGAGERVRFLSSVDRGGGKAEGSFFGGHGFRSGTMV